VANAASFRAEAGLILHVRVCNLRGRRKQFVDHIAIPPDEATTVTAQPEAKPIEISCAELKARFDAADALLLVDCREKDEFELVRIESAVLLPMSEIAGRVSELESRRDDEIIVHCHHGGRSLRVAMWLRGQGFPQAKSLAGGIDQWALEIDPTLPRY
jgi:rhodanese-related sulfurtransferase